MDFTLSQVFEAAKANAEENIVNGVNVLLGNALGPAPTPTANPTASTASPGVQGSGPFTQGAGGSGYPSNTGTLDYKNIAMYGLAAIAILGIAYVIVRK